VPLTFAYVRLPGKEMSWRGYVVHLLGFQIVLLLFTYALCGCRACCRSTSRLARLLWAASAKGVRDPVAAD
jgi:K+-transporting ATPase A subunit